jgi:UPF0755 protein
MKKIIIGISVISIVIAGIVIYPKYELYQYGNKQSIQDKKVAFFIREPMSLEDLASKLKEEGIIDDMDAFLAVGEYKSINKKNIARGKYFISPKTSYKALLNGFKKNSKGNGNAEATVKVSFNNCIRLDDLVQKLGNQLDIDTSAFLKEILQINYREKYGLEITKEQIPALIFPNTYQFYYDANASQFMDKMIKEYKRFWTKERMKKIKSIGLSNPWEVSTLASIVYAEQNQIPDEWPKIAAVYLNRLADPKEFPKLESCPTIKFCDASIKGQPTKKDKERNAKNPYNTYTHAGLPPGPINLPSVNVIDAVLNRSKERYVFMCAKPDYSQRNNFSTSLDQHNRHSDAFWKWYLAEKRKKSK